jgi:hypothetical protein
MAGESTLSRTYKSVLTTTLDKVLSAGSIQEQVYTKVLTLGKMREAGNIRVIDGGERIRIGIMHEQGTTYTRYDGYDPILTTPQEGMTTAWFPWAQAAVSVAISGKERRQNKGTSALANLEEAKIMQAEHDLVEGAATDLFSDGTADGGLQMDGLQAAVATTNTTGTYASLNFGAGNNEAWRNQVATTVGAAAVNGLSKLRNVANSCSEGQGTPSHPNFYVTTQVVHEAFEGLLQPQVTYKADGSRDAEMSVNPVFRGAPITWDGHCPSGILYVLNLEHLFLCIHKDANFSMSEDGFKSPVNGDSAATQILLMWQLVTDARRKQGKLTGLS